MLIGLGLLGKASSGNKSFIIGCQSAFFASFVFFAGYAAYTDAFGRDSGNQLDAAMPPSITSIRS